MSSGAIRRAKARRNNKPITKPKLKKLKSIPKELLETKFVPKITERIFDLFPAISSSSLSSAKRNLIFDEYNSKARRNIMRDLLSDNTAFDICNKEIGEGFIEGTLDNEDIEGFVISFKGTYIGFVFYEMKTVKLKVKTSKEVKIELICVKKPKGVLKGFPLGQIIMEVVFDLARSKKAHKVALESVQTLNTLSFYRKLGFRKFKELRSGLLLLKKVIK
jgi:hypothetical protein